MIGLLCRHLFTDVLYFYVLYVAMYLPPFLPFSKLVGNISREYGIMIFFFFPYLWMLVLHEGAQHTSLIRSGDDHRELDI